MDWIEREDCRTAAAIDYAIVLQGLSGTAAASVYLAKHAVCDETIVRVLGDCRRRRPVVRPATEARGVHFEGGLR